MTHEQVITAVAERLKTLAGLEVAAYYQSDPAASPKAQIAPVSLKPLSAPTNAVRDWQLTYHVQILADMVSLGDWVSKIAAVCDENDWSGVVMFADSSPVPGRADILTNTSTIDLVTIDHARNTAKLQASISYRNALT